MKTRLLAACLVFSTLLGPRASTAYDNSPADMQVIPEVIWAAATHGGTWVTQLQITAKVAGTTIRASFYYGPSTPRTVTLTTTTMTRQSLLYTNILSTLKSLDPSFTYEGRVGALVVLSQDGDHPIWAQAMTINGNYGKTFPGLRWVDGNTANVGRAMVIPNVRITSTYRTFVGAWNALSGGYPMTVWFYLYDANGASIGTPFRIDFEPWEFRSFNPFELSGVTSGTYANCWLYAWPNSTGNYLPDSKGLFCFGSMANNLTNDSSALIAVHYE